MKKKVVLTRRRSDVDPCQRPDCGAAFVAVRCADGRVAAGAVGAATGLADAFNLESQTVTLTRGSADSAQGNAFAMGRSAVSASSLLAPAVASSRSAAIARAP
jgi:hypothetical protein